MVVVDERRVAKVIQAHRVCQNLGACHDEEALKAYSRQKRTSWGEARLSRLS